MALLVVFAELPGSGKSTLARGVADAIGATCLRIDTIESAIVSTLMPYRDNPVGYVVAERIAADQLDAGRDVVADAVNGVAAAWAGWVMLAERTGAALWFVEVRCSDVAEHRRRVGGASRSCPGGSWSTTPATRPGTSHASSPGYRSGAGQEGRQCLTRPSTGQAGTTPERRRAVGN